jgi:serine/threonine protein kinase
MDKLGPQKFSKTIHGGCEFFLPARYVPVEIVGVGSYGAVIEAKDLKYHRVVAIKKIQNIMDEIDMKRILREIMILKYLKHDNIIQLYDVIFVRK